MNIFQNDDGFLGCLDSNITEDSLLSTFQLAKQIKLRLGKQGYLLDTYLSLLLRGLSNQLICDAAEEGFTDGGNLQRILFHVLDGTEPDEPHPLYPMMKEYYQQHVDNFQSQDRNTNLYLLTFPLADKILLYLTSSLLEEQSNSLHQEVDIIKFQQLYDQISHNAGEALMEELNKRLYQRFLLAPMVLSYAQGLNDDLLGRLVWRDPETSKQMFQLLIDQLPISDIS